VQTLARSTYPARYVYAGFLLLEGKFMLEIQNPLMLPIELNGRTYFTSHYFHSLYRGNAGEKYANIEEFNRLVRSIETYPEYVARADIVELKWVVAKGSGMQSLHPCFKATGYNPIMLINATAQIALTHHLDDALSKQVSVVVNENAVAADKLKYEMTLMGLECASRILNMSETSKIRGLTLINSEFGVSTKFLPAYTDELLTSSLTALLKERDSTLTAVAVNPILVCLGYLEQRTRRSTGSTVKKFWSITEAGLKYGKNETAPENPRQTAPLWFVHKFAELYVQIETYNLI
jgi:hypothetical protein